MSIGEVIALIKAFGGSGGGSSGGGMLVVNMVDDYSDKTWKEIHDAPMAVIVQEMDLSGRTMKIIGSITQVNHQNGEYSVSYYVLSPMGEITVSNLVTDSENGYLTWAE